ncbi:CCR4-NOT transcription complex subunit 1 [Psilocybe cubensis]|uniref:CCR4-NOT transcription complex subunit 1 n=1 Tax=Psilocybe cubensis TaxID=181762 RepID=A0ACB8H852_PSICU|nr:CCR4-NOT transcription complex subunit 1 [Psilocybe cubensis]KAH9483822.1 CCR4-NOT transcription complex subunit 1 [Psilocybe cubensis]
MLSLNGTAFTNYGWAVCFWSLIIPFQYGYHISVLNQIQGVLTCKVTAVPDALHALSPCIPMSDLTFSLVTSIFTLGGLAGSLVANLVMDRWGRRGTNRICTVFMAVGALFMGLSNSVFFLLLGRFAIGIASGLGLCVGPIFLSEIAPSKISGSIGVLTQLAVVLGIMFTQIAGINLAYPSQWRIVFFISFCLAVFQFISSSLVVESPAFLLANQRLEEQKTAARRLWGNTIPSLACKLNLHSPKYMLIVHIAEESLLNESDDEPPAPAQENVRVPQLFSMLELRKPLMIVSLVMVAQQISGINAVLYYSNAILAKSLPEFGSYISLGITIINRMGRKPLLATSFSGALFSLIALGFALGSGATTLSSVAIITFVMSFAVGLGPVPFVMIPEVSPPRLSEQHGIDTYLHFIRRLIVHTQPRLLLIPPASAFESSINLTFRLLVQETQRLARDPFLADRFRDAVGGGEGDVFRHFDFARFVDRIGLRPLERVVLAASIIAGQTRKELATQAAVMVRTEFDNAALELAQSPPLEHANFDSEQISKLMSNLLSDIPQDAPILDANQRQTLIIAAQTKVGKEALGPILRRIFAKLSLPPATSLVEVLIQLGPEITSDPEIVKALLERFGITDSNPPRDDQVVEIVSTLSQLAGEGAVICDVGAFVRALVSYNVPLNWPGVIKSFDWPDRHGVDTATLKMLIAILLNSPRDADPHAVTGFWQTWSNPLYQLRLLDALLSLPADTFNFVQLPGRRIVTVDDVSIASPTIKSLAANVQGQTWNSLELFQVLVRLAGSEALEVRSCVREMLDKAIKISAEIVHMGLLQVPDLPWNDIRLEYSRKLLGMFLAGHPNHQLVFMRIWQIEPSYLTNAFRDFYDENNLNITRILDVAQDLKILESLLEVRPFTFALDVAALASRREYLNLDKWLADNVTAYGTEFLHSVIRFLEQKMESEKLCRLSDPPMESRTMALNPTTITIILRVLRHNSSLLNENDLAACVGVRDSCLQIHPRLMSMSPNNDSDTGMTVITYSNEIETEVDGIYKQMYDENISIDEVITMLQRYKESNNPRDHEVFSCMIHFLFDEYKFFQSYYPPRELAMTGYLFGSLIRHSLIDYMPLTIAIRYIIDALHCPPETNLFKFGMQALSRFESRLKEWRPVCESLLQIPHFVEARPDLAAAMQRILSSPGDPADNVSDSHLMLSNPPYDSSPPFSSIQPDVISEPLEVPPEELSDRILFIVNNLAPNNFDSKVKEMREQFVDQYSRWFANYLVDQRISTEPNNHPLYLRFLDALDRQPLFKFILQETFIKAAALLNSDRSIAGSDRNALKNVGTWLGTITLARDQPIKHKNLSFKDLLIEGYESGRLVVAIPFVCKTLEPCAKSKVFKPPNPWLMAVISLLAELYHFAELKLNLKFDIEILCKGLDIDLDAVEPTMILRNRPLDSMTGLPLPEYTPDISLLPIGNENPAGQIGDSQILVLGGQGSPESQRALTAHIEAILGNLMHLVHINGQLAPYDNNATFKRAVQHAVDRAVREIILPVVERSVTIAGISTRELVSKDYSTEPNEEKLRRAGHLMAQKLAGSLALVTCKEPLKSNLATHLRQSLADAGFGAVADSAVILLVQDNLDIACAAIEKAAMEQAVTDVDDGFRTSYEVRRRHRELRNGQPFWDPSVSHSAFTSSLPDPLRIKPTGVQPLQAAVYEDFGNYFSTTYMQQICDSPSLDHALNQGIHSHQDAMERFSILTRDLEAVMLQYPNQSLANLPPNHDIRHLVRQIMLLAEDSANREPTPLMMSQKIVQLLYKTNSPLGREVYVALLDQLCRMFEDVAKEAITWLLYAEDERKFNVPVTATLLRSGLINVTLQDQQLAKLLYDDPRQILMSFAANLIRECLSSDPPVATQGQFAYSIEMLTQLAAAGKGNEDVNRLVDDLRGIRRSSGPMSPDVAFALQPQVKAENDQLREKLFIWFQQWITIFQRSHSPEKSFVPFITQLTKQGILKVEDVSSFFFRVCAETSVNSYIKNVAAGELDYAFQPLDAMSRLIVYIIKYHGDASGVNNNQAKVHYLTKILSIFVLVLASAHEDQGPNFQQKPFFRFFSSLVNDLHSIESHLGPVYFQLLIAISDTYSSLQPTYFPGFAFSWMCLISHRLFMPKLLLSANREGWSAFHKLLLSLFKFLAPFLRDADLQVAARDLYRGALRLLLVLLHDFPEFLSEYYFTLCDAIPPRCIQLRNIILSAFPPAIVLPDPHLRNIKFDAIPEMGPIPPILSDFASGLKTGDLRGYLDQYLLNRGNPSFLPSLKDRLKVKSNDSTENYNLSLVNSLVMYIGVSSVAQAKARSGSSLFVATDPGVVALQYLVINLDVEGQHHLLTAMVLHLRYPNAHTHWFSSLLLHLFLEVNDDRFREVMTKVLLERFIVHRPHPWGALVTFIELLRNPKYDFWSKDFIRIGPEVTMLLESVGAFF